MNKKIWTGDNLPIMRGMNSESVDLIYLDPPFNSKTDYAAPIGSKAAGAEFKDTWTLRDIDVAWINLIEEKHPQLHRILLAAMTKSDKSYLAYMAVRLLEMRRLLKATASLYLHCDPTMSHYLRLLLDAIFGRDNFRNEIVWHYGKWSNVANHFQKNHDVILLYTKSNDYTFNPCYYAKKEKKAYHTNKVQGKGQMLIYDIEATPKRKVEEYRYKGYAIVDVKDSQQIKEHDVWTYVRDKSLNYLNSQAKERTGYPTQKPLEILRRIIKVSSNPSDIVFDPFCGCATTCVAAEFEYRSWVGIDISEKAQELVIQRIKDDQGEFLRNVGSITHRTDIPKRTDLGRLPQYNCRENKENLYGEQAGNCAGCMTHFEMRHLTVDHIIDRNSGGTDPIENLQLLCGNCNSVKGNRGMEYLMTKLQMQNHR